MIDTDETMGMTAARVSGSTWKSRQQARLARAKSERMIVPQSRDMKSEMEDISNSEHTGSRQWRGGNILSKVTAPFAWPKGGKFRDASPLSMLTSIGTSFKISNSSSHQKDTKATIFATDMYSDYLILTRISQLAENELVSTLELEEVIMRKNVHIFEELGNLFQVDDRIWTRIKFRDSMNIGKYFEYKSMKTSLISHLDAAKNEPITFQAKVRCFKKMGSNVILDSLQELLNDDSIKEIVLSGDLIGSNVSDAKTWKTFEDMLYSERWDRLNINLFYDMNESHVGTHRPWIGHLERTLRSLKARFSGQSRFAGLNILPGNTEWADFVDGLSSSDFDSGSSRRDSFRRSLTEPCLQPFAELVDLSEEENQDSESSTGQEFAEETVAAKAKTRKVAKGSKRRSSSFDESKSKVRAAKAKAQIFSDHVDIPKDKLEDSNNSARQDYAEETDADEATTTTEPVVAKRTKRTKRRSLSFDDSKEARAKAKEQKVKVRRHRVKKDPPATKQVDAEDTEQHAHRAVKHKRKTKSKGEKKSLSNSDSRLEVPKDLEVSTKHRNHRAKSHHGRRKRKEETDTVASSNTKSDSKDVSGTSRVRRRGRSVGRVQHGKAKSRSRTGVRLVIRSKSPIPKQSNSSCSKSPTPVRTNKRSTSPFPKPSSSSTSPTQDETKKRETSPSPMTKKSIQED